MANAKTDKLDKVLAEARRASDLREQGYREQALKLYPHICGRCSREFTRKNLHELTVHHRDHDHDNNPPDGSNWELLCLYCHDREHSDHLDSGYAAGAENDRQRNAATYNPFANLAEILKSKK